MHHFLIILSLFSIDNTDLDSSREIYTAFLKTYLCSRYFVLAKTNPNEKAGKAFTGFIVDADSPGVIKGRKV